MSCATIEHFPILKSKLAHPGAKSEKRMLTIGVVGGIASGKTQVAKFFEEFGCRRLDADVMGHAVLTEPEVKAKLRARWGTTFFASDGEVDRQAVARLVFGDSAESVSELRFLESVTHPRIKARLFEMMDQARKQKVAGVVLDAALLMKAGWDELCDHIVFVDVPREQRLNRALSRGWTESQFDARENSQIDISLKRKRATSTIDNSGPLMETFQEVQKLWITLSSQANSTGFQQ